MQSSLHLNMFNSFALLLSSFVVIVISFENISLESESYEIRVINLGLRQERIGARVCEDEQTEDGDEDWDLCFEETLFADTSRQISANDLKSLSKETHCKCDRECHLYRDCCVDNLSEDFFSENKTNLSCVQLFSESIAIGAVYGTDRCGDNWMETKHLIGVKDKCELSAYDFNSGNRRQRYTYLQDIPVLSQTSNIMYKNIFCAVCNNDSSELKSWNISVVCKGLRLEDQLKHQQHVLNPDNYDPLLRKWKVMVTDSNKTMSCSIAVHQFSHKTFVEQNNLRKCKKTINSCPLNWRNSSVDQKCRSYASYVYENNLAYQNYHCALCNGAHLRYASCFANSSFEFQDWSSRNLWFPLLLDFNFAGNKGEWIGGEHKCPDRGQLYDPLYDKCVYIQCNHNSSECLIDDPFKSSFGSNCSAIVILDEKTDFIVLQNKSIYINKTQSILDEESDYEVYSDSNDIKLRICRNKSELNTDSLIQSPFDVSLAQILLSEISLYTSILCLSLHLLTYSVLPKLRNLPGKNLMSLSSALLLAHISFTIASHLEADRKILCVLVAITTHYSYLAAFFWMSVMAFDVCKTFRRTTSRRSKTSNRYKFLKYSLYAWLTPAFVVILSAAFDIGFKESKFQPLYGYRFCWISQRQALLVFFVVPISIIVCLNIFLFTLTAKGLIKTEEQTKILKKKSDKIRYFLYIKLAIIMGLTWTFGFVASLSDIKILWYPYIIFNGLQGAIIFIAFTCKRKVWNQLCDRFGIKKGYQRSATNSDVIRSATGSTALQSSSLVPKSPDSNVTKIKFTK